MNKKKLLIIGSISAVAVIGFILFKKFKPTTETEAETERSVPRKKKKIKIPFDSKRAECEERGGKYIFGGRCREQVNVTI